MKKFIYIIIIAAMAIAIASLSGLDIWISKLLYQKGADPAWIYSKYFLWTFFYNYGPYLPLLIASVALIVLILGYFIKELNQYRKKALMTILVLLIAPGFIVQTLKVSWGRPRPYELVEFGGKYEYRTPFLPNFDLAGNKSEGNSFPSGHAAIGFYMMILYFVFKKRWELLAFGLIYGALMGAGRIAQGGHFFSDVLASFFIVFITATALKVVFFPKME